MTQAETWRVLVPDHSPETSLTASQGGVARKLWGERFSEVGELMRFNSELLFTGIGGGAAFEEGSISLPLKHGDGTQVPFFVNLEEKFQRVPKVLFMVCSMMFSDQLVGLLSAAQEYKNQGVSIVVPVLTASAHERQDHYFRENGERILQPITVDTVIKMLIHTPADQGGPLCNGVLLIGSHSMRSIITAAKFDFPILPIDPYNFMVEGAGLRQRENLVVLSPDKGRRNDGMRLAHELSVPYGACEKVRARITSGDATVILKNSKLLQYIKKTGATVVYFDDEIREATTMAGGRLVVAGAARNLVIVSFKGIFAGLRDREGISAADLLAQPLLVPFESEEIIVSNAVEAVRSVEPIRHKLTVLPLGGEIRRMIKYLQQNPVPSDENWLREPEAGLLELSLVEEKYE